MVAPDNSYLANSISREFFCPPLFLPLSISLDSRCVFVLQDLPYSIALHSVTQKGGGFTKYRRAIPRYSGQPKSRDFV